MAVYPKIANYYWLFVITYNITQNLPEFCLLHRKYCVLSSVSIGAKQAIIT
jgi:hypothetical protein